MQHLEIDITSAHKKLRELLKSSSNILLTKELDVLLKQQIAIYNLLLLETEPAKKLTGCQAKEMTRLFSSMLRIIDFCSLLVRLAETQPAAFPHEADFSYYNKLKTFSTTFSNTVATARKEHERVEILQGQIQDILYGNLIDISPETRNAFEEKIKNSADRNLLDMSESFEHELSKEFESRENKIRNAWNNCIDKMLCSETLLLLAPVLLTCFHSSPSIGMELQKYSTAMHTAKSLKSSKELTTFRFEFRSWYKEHLSAIHSMNTLFDLLDNADACIIWQGTKKSVASKTVKAFNSHLIYKPACNTTLGLVDLIKTTITQFECLQKNYNDIKDVLRFKEQQEANKTQKNAKTKEKNSTVARLIKQFDQVKADATNDNRKVHLHRRRSSSVASSDDNFPVDPRMQRMTSSAKLTTHYRSAQSVLLTSIIEEEAVEAQITPRQ